MSEKAVLVLGQKLIEVLTDLPTATPFPTKSLEPDL
jgi:hypothetical protein